MAVFTFIATKIVYALGTIAGIALTTTTAAGALALTTAGTIATSIIAGGLGYVTAKVTGVFKPPSIQQAKDPGVKVQLSPSTDHRVPVFYGSIQTGGIITDAGITNQNNTMIYVMVIGEKTDTGNFTINEIRRQDAVLNFSGATVTSITDPNATASNLVNGKMRCRVYAGNAQSNVNQIFPTTNKVAASTLLSTINVNTNYEDLVYAVFEMDYDPENGLTGLGSITFDITNSLSSPANVIGDYILNSRYGAGLSSDEFDTTSLDAVWDYSNILGTYGNVEYTTNANVSAYHDRWKIDGVLSTYQPVLNNIDELCQSCATFFVFDNKSGKYKCIPNRALTTPEKANCFVFNDDNIISKIDITSTELYSLYNGIEAEYPSYEQKDQTKVAIVSTPSGDRNTNEPDNVLNTRYNLVNDYPRVANLANIDLRQSRLSTTLSFEATHQALQVDVGDVVKVTNSLYGFTDKLFRVMQVTEVEREDGVLRAKLLLLEYDDSIYTHSVEVSDGALGLSLIPGWWSGIVGNANITIPGNVIVTDPGNANANVVDPVTGNVVGNVGYGNIDWANTHLDGITTKPDVPITNIPITTPNTPGIENMVIDMGSEGGGYSGVAPYRIPPPDGSKYYEPNANYNLSVPTPSNPRRDPTLPNYPLEPDFTTNIDVSGEGGGGEWQTPKTRIPNVPMTNPGRINASDLQDVGASFQIDEAPAAILDLPYAGSFTDTVANTTTSNIIDFSTPNDTDFIVDSELSGSGIPANTVVTAVNSNTQVQTNNNVSLTAGDTVTIDNANATAMGQPGSQVVPSVTADLGAIDYGDYTSLASMTPVGGLSNTGASLNFFQRDTVAYEEVDANTLVPTGNTIFDVQQGDVLTNDFSTAIPPTLKNDFKATISPAQGQVAANAAYAAANISPPSGMAYYPTNVTVQPMANSTLDLNSGGQRGLKYKGDTLRTFKADQYRSLRP